MRILGVLFLIATCLFATPLASALALPPTPVTSTLVITLNGSNDQPFVDWQATLNGAPVPPGACGFAMPAIATPADPTSAQVICNVGILCLTAQASTFSTGHAGGIIGYAWCGTPAAIPASASVAPVVPKDVRSFIGPTVLQLPPLPPENCLADWRLPGQGPWTVVCTFTIV
jgi:hypothetical protein